jgi:hypothetical protein
MRNHAEESRISAVIRAGTYYGEAADETLKEDIIAEHNKISIAKGSVLLGKLGRIPGADKVRLIEDAIEKKRASLLVVKKNGSEYDGFSAPLFSVHIEDYTPDISSVPSYYQHLIPEIKLWFEIGTFVPVSEEMLQEMLLISNDKPLLVTLKSCRTSLIFVKSVQH